MSIEGCLLLDKPLGMSSNQALQKVRRLLGAAKAGHAGSLDPLASGMLPIFFGQATRLLTFLLQAQKSYRVRAVLGRRSITGDAEGWLEGESFDPTSIHERLLEAESIKTLLKSFEGEQKQIPPMYSALKQQGKPLYAYARAGLCVERAPRSIHIESILFQELIQQAGTWPLLDCDIVCSKGTYIRTLIEDIGEKIGCGASVQALRRLSVGAFRPEQMVSLDRLSQQSPSERSEHIYPLDSLKPYFSHMPTWALSVEDYTDIQRARRYLRSAANPQPGWYCIEDAQGRFSGLLESKGEAEVGGRILW